MRYGKTWYEAMARLTGLSPWEHWAAHYPGQAEWCGLALTKGRAAFILARTRACGVTGDRILAEERRGKRRLYVVLEKSGGCWCPCSTVVESAKALRDVPVRTVGNGGAVFIVAFGDCSRRPVARWDGKRWERVKPK